MKIDEPDIKKSYKLYFFMNNQGHASTLNVTYVFKVFRAQSCLMVAQVIYVCKEFNSFHDSKSIFMINDLNVFQDFFETAKFWYIVSLLAILHLLQSKNPTSL